MANTTTKVDLVINRMSQSKYEQLKSAGQLDPNQIYMTTDGIDPVPDTRKVNGQTLEADVTLTGADIAVSTTDTSKISTALAGKAATNHTHSNYVPTSRTVNNKALSGNVTLTAEDIQTSESSGQSIYSALQSIGATAGQAAADATTALQDLAGKASDSDVVHKTGAETIAGVKTFSDGIVMASSLNLDYYDLEFGGTGGVYANIGNNGDEVFFWYNDNFAMLKVGDGGTLAFTAGTGHAGEIATLDANGNPVASGYDTSDFLTSVPTSYKTYNDTKTQLGTDGFKTYSATKTQLGTDGFKTYADTKTALDSVYKPLQTAKSSPTASGSTTSFIDTISQNANGVITATKKTIPSASTTTSGIVQLNDTLTSTLTTQAATANAVKQLDDKLSQAIQEIIAPEFTAKSYAQDELCIYNNKLYACESEYTATAQSPKPDVDTAHWVEASVESVIDYLRRSKADSSHAHGNITSAGALQATDIAIANGDKLVVTDASSSNKVARTSVAFDGSTTTQFLSKKGTWETPVITGYVSKAELATAIAAVGSIPSGDNANLENTIAKFNLLIQKLTELAS